VPLNELIELNEAEQGRRGICTLKCEGVVRVQIHDVSHASFRPPVMIGM